jgi:hypothetical protein
MNWQKFILPILLFFSLTHISCDDSFTPVTDEFLDNYSIFGYLDAEADTQWVRIMPIRETIDRSVSELPESVTLTTSLGQIFRLNAKEKVFNLQGENTSVWNYWTNEQINADETYLLQAIHPNGEITQSTAYIPEDFTTPLLEGNLLSFPMLDTLADVRLSWVIRDNINDEFFRISFSERNNVYWSVAKQEYRGFINPNKSYLKIAELMGISDPYLVTLNGDIEIIETELSIVQAGEGWVDFFELTRDEIAIQTIQANVNNGVGLFIGTVIKRIPFPVCIGDAGDVVVCEN